MAADSRGYCYPRAASDNGKARTTIAPRTAQRQGTKPVQKQQLAKHPVPKSKTPSLLWTCFLGVLLILGAELVDKRENEIRFPKIFFFALSDLEKRSGIDCRGRVCRKARKTKFAVRNFLLASHVSDFDKRSVIIFGSPLHSRSPCGRPGHLSFLAVCCFRSPSPSSVPIAHAVVAVCQSSKRWPKRCQNETHTIAAVALRGGWSTRLVL